MTIKILEKTEECAPVEFKQGDWFDLCAAQDIKLKVPEAQKMHIRGKDKNNTGERVRDVEFQSLLIPLGVCIQVPKGYECILVPRSSSFRDYGILQTNSIGVIDQSYCSDEDEWKLPVLATKEVSIPKGTRIAQFRVQLSQRATRWQKIKHLFSGKPKIIVVDSLSNPVRGGFGSTGKC